MGACYLRLCGSANRRAEGIAHKGTIGRISKKSSKRLRTSRDMSKLRSSYPCAGAQGVRRAEFPLRTLGSQRSLADSLTALLHGETTVSPTPFADPPFIPA